jgi:hypothetical protein
MPHILAKLTIKFLSQYIQLPNNFKFKNTIDIIHDLKTIPFNLSTVQVSFDVWSMYTNIPNKELILIIDTKLKEILIIHNKRNY